MHEDNPRVVFDCNVFLQGLASRKSPARRASRLFFSGAVTLYVSADTMAELRDVLNRPSIRKSFPKLTDRLVNALLEKVQREAIFIWNVPEEFRFERDPKDECYLNLAIVTNAKCIVSRDKDLLDLMTAMNPNAVTFRQRYPFLKVIKVDAFVQKYGKGAN